MIAIALTGGGNRGPLQVGALQALFAHGIWPDLVVGTSAGALNAAYLAADGTPAATDRLADVWRSVDFKTVYAGNYLQLGWRFLRGDDSLFASDKMREIIATHLEPLARTYADLKLPCYITTSDLRTNRLWLFPAEDDKSAPLVDTVLASAALPGMHPPVPYLDTQLVDGGVVDNVPAGIAMAKGATVVYLINVGYGGAQQGPVKGMKQILGRTLNTFMAQSLFQDLDQASANPDIALHHIHITEMGDIPFTDFNRVDAMLEAGRNAAERYLRNPQPRQPLSDPSDRSLSAPDGSPESPPHLPGAQPFIPTYRSAR
ncbi:MAG: patatin-like phospholipase family protein [Caldilineaceae bacterium]|nr:patatin-like phospholipase family protein [Caldilineaceae bacterium]